MRVAIVTGVSGQDGYYMAKLLLNHGYKVYGISRSKAEISHRNYVHLKFPNIHSFSCSTVISDLKPDEFYHFAAQSDVAQSFKSPDDTYRVNTIYVIDILQYLNSYSPKTKFFLASSSNVFGDNYSVYISRGGLQRMEHFNCSITNPKDILYAASEPFHSEETPMSPNNPYGISKASAMYIVDMYRKTYGMQCYTGILYNHESSRRKDCFVTKKIIKWACKYKLNNNIKPLKLGNVDAYKDIGWIDDYMDGIYRMVQSDPGNYIVSSGDICQIKYFLDLVLEKLNIKLKDGDICIDDKLKRPSEICSAYGNHSKLTELTGWTHTTNIYSIVDKMVEAELNDQKRL